MKRVKAVASILMAGLILQGSIVGATGYEGVPKAIESRERVVARAPEGWVKYMSTTHNLETGEQDGWSHGLFELEVDDIEFPEMYKSVYIDKTKGMKKLTLPDTLYDIRVTSNQDLEELTIQGGYVVHLGSNPKLNKVVLERGVKAIGNLWGKSEGEDWEKEGRKVHIYIPSTVTEFPQVIVGCNKHQNLVIHTPKDSPAYKRYSLWNDLTVIEEPEDSPIWGDKALESERLAKYEKNKKVYEEVYGREKRIGVWDKRTAKKEALDNVEGVLNNTKVYVDGKEVNMRSYLINGNNYVPIREFADKIKQGKKPLNVDWNSEKQAINIITGEKYSGYGMESGVASTDKKQGKKTDAPLLIDGYIADYVLGYNIESNNHFKLRDLGEVFDISVEWDNDTSSVHIETGKSYSK